MRYDRLNRDLGCSDPEGALVLQIHHIKQFHDSNFMILHLIANMDQDKNMGLPNYQLLGNLETKT